MRVMLVGANGQLGRTLSETVDATITLCGYSRDALDITDQDRVLAEVTAQQPAVIINAAAYTAVDQAEDEPALAAAVNTQGPANLAVAAREVGARLIHLSTDYVFDGSRSTPYSPADPTCPQSVYGQTKLAGEQRVLACLPEGATIVRTAWVYAPYGRNFVQTMLRLMRDDGRRQLSVVCDQIGSPTATASLAALLWQMVAVGEGKAGIYHWSDDGVASWYDFAVAIAEEGKTLGLLDNPPEVIPIGSAAYPTKAKRPAYSVLDKTQTKQDFDIKGRHWRVALRDVLQQMQQEQAATH